MSDFRHPSARVRGVLLRGMSLVAAAQFMTAGAAVSAAADLPQSPAPAQTPASPGETITAQKVDPQAVPEGTAAVSGQEGEAPAAGASFDDIVVTASRVGRAGFAAPTPTSVLDSAEFAKTGVATPADLLNRSPVFASSTTPASTGSSTTNTPGANFLNLRGLGPTRTLVLVNGQRFVPTSTTGTIDVNLIPSLLIDRVDVVTGGASAAWGSDAVSGVVNFILNDRLKGLKANFQGGVSEHGDDGQVLAQAAYGAGFLDDRLRITVAGEYYRNDGGGAQGSRDWGDDRWNLVANPAFTGGPGEFIRVVSPGVGFSNATAGGLITNRTGPLANIQFGPGGTVVPFRYGTLVGSSLMVGGDGEYLDQFQTLAPRQQRYNAYGQISYEFGPALTASVSAQYARSEALARSTPPADYGNITIQRDNAFLPQSVRAIMLANNIASFRMGRLNQYDLGFIETDNTTEVQRYVASLKGSFGGSWKWGGYYEHGESSYHQVYLNNRNQARWTQGVDAVVNQTNGQIVCRSTLTDPSNGCVPINVFGVGSVSQAARDYVLADPFLRTRIEENAAGANIAGEPFSLWAGPVSIAAGGEYRKQTLRTTVDPLSEAGAYRIGNPKATAGEVDVKEVFGELVVPLAKDVPFLRSLELNGAIRYADYSISGGVTSWKAGGTWEPTTGIRFRAARSRDIRAPNLNDYFSAPRQVTMYSVVDPVTRVQSQVTQLLTGNTALRPELADTLTYGVVFEPGFAPGLRASFDVADIRIDRAISTLLPQDTVDRCASGNAALCDLLTRNAAGVITTVRSPFLNLASIKSRSLDGEISYRLPLSRISDGASGVFDLRLLGTYLFKFETDDGATLLRQAGTTERPRYRQTARLTYSDGPFDLFVEDLFISNSRNFAQYSGNQISDNSIPSRNYVNLSATFRVPDRNVEFFGVVTNLFDRDPPIVPSGQVFGLETNASTYDVLGRRFTFGLRITGL